MLGLAFAGRGEHKPELPGPYTEREVPARPPGLVAAYLDAVQGDVAAWGNTLPPHFFSQWGFPMLAGAFAGLPYELKRAVNAGFSWESRAPLPANEPLRLRARLKHIDDDGKRALLHSELITGTESAPESLVSTLIAYVPLPRRGGAAEEGGAPDTAKKAKPTVPADAELLLERELSADLGGRFACATGDVNPIHWLGPYARMAGFGGVILHGYATAALGLESYAASRLNGDRARLVGAEGRFTQPLRLPAKIGIFAGKPEAGRTPLFVGVAPGEAAWFVGSVTAAADR